MWPAVLAFPRRLQSLRPMEERLHFVQDNCVTHERVEVRRHPNLAEVARRGTSSWRGPQFLTREGEDGGVSA